MSEYGDSTIPPGDLFSVQCLVTIIKRFFLCLNVIYFSVPIASCPSVATVEQFSLLARSSYRKNGRVRETAT